MEGSTHDKGRHGEDRATAILRRSGYSIVERNYRCPLGEIDIVARDGDALVFVEVRTRRDASRGNALETVRRGKQRRLGRVAAHYLMARRPTLIDCRFDVIGITGDEVVLIRDAFRL